VLSLQLVRMSQLNWRKHRLLQCSVTTTALAVGCLVVLTVGSGH
jgi:hypothetical protein